MAEYVVPNTKIYIIKDCPCEPDYKNTMYFARRISSQRSVSGSSTRSMHRATKDTALEEFRLNCLSRIYTIAIT